MTEKSGLTWYQDLIYSIFFFGSGFIAFYLTKDNQTPEVASGVYIAGIVFGIVLTLIFVYIIRHKCLPVQEKTRKSEIARWLCFAGIIIVGIILALVFVKGIVIPAIWQIDTAFILGEVIGALIIVSLIHFEEIQYLANKITNFITGKKSE